MYSREYTSGFSGPVASSLAAPLSPRHEGNVGQLLVRFIRERLLQSPILRPTGSPLGPSPYCWRLSPPDVSH